MMMIIQELHQLHYTDRHADKTSRKNVSAQQGASSVVYITNVY